ncbi:MAG: hypothetical protein FJZ01_02945 [Candidatus Sericytochromatia bacterium]|nr:hypothetical protein [Candidatus Tanganyikabacteria bacterium]
MTVKKSRIPEFGSDQEEREFWLSHSVEEFADEMEELDVDIRPTRAEQIAIRLFPEDLAVLRAEAQARSMGHTTLARTILEAWVKRARQRTSTGSPDRQRPSPRAAKR